MSEKVADYIVDRLCRGGYIQNREKGIYRVGFDVIVGTLISGSAILGLGILLKDAVGAVLFLVVFCTVRNHCGGYHAKTRLKCLLTMMAVFGGVSVLSDFVLESSDVWKLSFGAMSAVLGGAMSVFVPVTDITKRYRPDDVARNRKKALWILFIWYAVVGVCILWNRMAAVKISMTMDAVAVMILVTKPWKRAVIRMEATDDEEKVS